jgi:tetratricopeptide (TPR) repeat protein
MKKPPPRNLNIIGDFLKYTIILFVPFFIMGVTFILIYEFSFTYLIFNPLMYSIGISLIIIVLTHDVNDILDLVGKAKGPRLGHHVKYANAVQEIGLLMGMSDFETALHKAENLVRKEPEFTHALNMKGECMLRGFQRYGEARKCFNKVLKLSDPDDEQYMLAEALKAETYANEES